MASECNVDNFAPNVTIHLHDDASDKAYDHVEVSQSSESLIWEAQHHVINCLPKDGSGIGWNAVLGIAAFDDGSVLLAGVTEGNWAIDTLGERDFAVAKLNASGYLEWSWQVTQDA